MSRQTVQPDFLLSSKSNKAHLGAFLTAYMYFITDLGLYCFGESPLFGGHYFGMVDTS